MTAWSGSRRRWQWSSRSADRWGAKSFPWPEVAFLIPSRYAINTTVVADGQKSEVRREKCRGALRPVHCAQLTVIRPITSPKRLSRTRRSSAASRQDHREQVSWRRQVETFDAAAETSAPAHDPLSRGFATATLTAEVTRVGEIRLRKMCTNRGNPQGGADR